MMHEFRLPSLGDSVPPKRYIDKNSIPANDAWAICRIFKKANSNAQRALSNSWVSPDLRPAHTTTLTSQNLPPHYQTSTTTTATPTCHNNLHHSSSITNPTPNFDLSLYKAYNQMASGGGYAFFGQETADYPLSKCNIDTSSLLFNMSSTMFGDFEKVPECVDYKGIDDYANTCFPPSLQQVEQNVGHGGENLMALLKESCPSVIPLDDELGLNIRASMGLPYIFPLSMSETWRSSLVCDSSPCPSDQMSASYSTNKCNT
ncbi:hypothetical protein ACET3Z_029399 [Daucus carota]